MPRYSKRFKLYLWSLSNAAQFNVWVKYHII